MGRCPQCGQKVANFARHNHDPAAYYVPWPALVIAKLVRKLRPHP